MNRPVAGEHLGNQGILPEYLIPCSPILLYDVELLAEPQSINP